jgi:CubicO group peptidase (beta-lactamase class C family)
LKARTIVCLAVVAAAVSFCCLSCSKPQSVAVWPTSGWSSASPEVAGMDPGKLTPLRSLRRSLTDVTSVLAVRHGLIVFEQYYTGDEKTLRNLREATKAVVSSLVGAAIQQGLIDSIDQKMVDFFPENALLKSDPRLQGVTLRHLLTMSDGIRASGNTVQYTFTDGTLSLPLKSDPGLQFEDNFMSAQLVSMILTRASGASAHDFARKYLFTPLGIGESLWADFEGQEGVSHGGDGLLLTTRDMAKLGYLFLKGGSWDSQPLLPEQWITESTAEQIQTGEQAGYFRQYGFLWWVYRFAEHPGYFAAGTGGQVICVVPDLDLVVVTTSKAETLGGAARRYLQVVEEHIIGSVKD